MHSGILSDKQEEPKITTVEVTGSDKEIERLQSKRPKSDMVKKNKTRKDLVRDSISAIAGLLSSRYDDEDYDDDLDDLEDGDYDELDEDDYDDCQMHGRKGKKYKGLLEQEYASNLNKHSKAGGV